MTLSIIMAILVCALVSTFLFGKGKSSRIPSDGFFFVWGLAFVGFVGFVGLSAYLCFIFRNQLSLEVTIIIVVTGLVCWCLVCQQIWKTYVYQNPEDTTSIFLNPDGSQVVITHPGRLYKKPGSVGTDNQIVRNIQTTDVNFDVTTSQGLSIVVAGVVQWFFSDTSNYSAIQKMNKLGSNLNQTVDKLVRSYFAESGDALVQGESYSDIRFLTRNRRLFLDELESYFRTTYEAKLQRSLSIEIIDPELVGISLNLTVPPATEKALEELFTADNIRAQAQAIIALGRENGQTIPLQEAIDQAAATLAGKIQRFSGGRNVGILTGTENEQ